MEFIKSTKLSNYTLFFIMSREVWAVAAGMVRRRALLGLRGVAILLLKYKGQQKWVAPQKL